MLLVKDIYEDSKNMSKLKFTSNFVILSVFFIEKNYKLNFLNIYLRISSIFIINECKC